MYQMMCIIRYSGGHREGQTYHMGSLKSVQLDITRTLYSVINFLHEPLLYESSGLQCMRDNRSVMTS